MRKKRILAFALAVVMMMANTVTAAASPVVTGGNVQVQIDTVEEESVVETTVEEVETFSETTEESKEDVSEAATVVETVEATETTTQESVVEETSEAAETVVMEEEPETAEEKEDVAVADENGFVIEDGVLKEYTGDATEVVIPDGVTEIGTDAFYKAAITKVSLPASVEKIGSGAFAEITGLTEVEWSEGLKEIGVKAFNKCSALSSIYITGTEAEEGVAVIPGTVEKTGDRIFAGCEKLPKLVFTEGMEKIPDQMAFEATYVTEIEIPDTVKEIGLEAFYKSGLTKVSLPASVEKIDASAFAEVTSLTEVKWNEGLKQIGVQVFKNCSALSSIYLEGTTKEEGVGVIPSTVEKTGDRIFIGCEKLPKLVFTEGMKKIPDYMAKVADYVEEVEIPDTVKEIGSEAFYGCTSLAIVPLPKYLESIDSSAFSGCTALGEIVFPYSLKKIESNAFYNCSLLKELVFYHALESIGGYAFGNNTLLNKVHFNSTKTNISSTAFDNTSEDLVIYCYEYSTAKALAEEKAIDYKVIPAMNIEEDGFAVANTEENIIYPYNTVRKKGSGRNVAVLDAQGKVIAKGAWKPAESVVIEAEETVEVSGFGFSEGTGELLYAVGMDGSRLDINLDTYEMVKAVPYEQYEAVYKDFEGLTTDEFEAKKIALSYQNRDGNMLGISLISVLNYWDLLSEGAKGTSVLPIVEKKELNAFSYDEYDSTKEEFVLNGASALAQTAARLQLWQDTSEYEEFAQSIKANPLTVDVLKDYVGITNREVQEIETIWLTFEEGKESNSHMVLLDTSRNIELVTPEEKESLNISEDESWYKVYLLDPDYPIYDDDFYCYNGKLNTRTPSLSDAYASQNCLYIKEGTGEWIFNGKTNVGQKSVTYNSVSGNTLGIYALTAQSFSNRVVQFANGDEVGKGDGSSLPAGFAEIHFNAADVSVVNAAGATVFAMTAGNVTANALDYVKLDIDEMNPDGRKNVTIRVPDGVYSVSVSEGFWLYSDDTGYCGTGSDGAITATVQNSVEYTVNVPEGKEIIYYLGNYVTEAESDSINMEYCAVSPVEDTVKLALDAEQIISVTMNEETKGFLSVVDATEPSKVYERKNAYLAEADGWNILDFVNSRRVEFVTFCEVEIEPQNIYLGELIIEPEAPVKEGYTLCGWSIDETFANDWDFAVDTVQDDMILYARWRDNIRDKELSDTTICIDIVEPKTYVYNGKAITPNLIVRDDNKVLVEGVDYKVTYKNNVKACDHTDTAIKDSKKPQAIVQGIGKYKATHKFVEYFSIQQADMADLSVTVPERVAAKAKNKLQKIKPVVKTEKVTVAAKDYIVKYYMDEELTYPVNGLTTAGTYYVVIEAKKNSLGVYTGNFKGVSEPAKVEVVAADQWLSKAKVTVVKGVKANATVADADMALQAVISTLKIGKNTYKTAGTALDTWKQYFTVSAIDYDGTEISENEFYKVVNTAGSKTIIIRAAEDNDKNYVGEISVKVTIAGTKLNKKQFKLSYAAKDEKEVTSAEYTAVDLVPSIYTDLLEGTDYQVTYKYGKNVIAKEDIVNAGSYTAVITGIEKYSGSVSFKFTISKVNLAKAYSAGKINILSDGAAVEQNLAGAKKEFAVFYDADGAGEVYEAVELTADDYKISYKNNTKASVNGKTAYASLSGKGNFAGTLKGDGKLDSTSTKSGIAPELNYVISAKNMDSEDIHVLIKGLTYKKGALKGAKFTVYDNGKAVSAKDYTSSVSEENGTVTLVITGKNINYTGSKTIMMKADLIKVTDSKKVKISFKEDKKYFYSETSHRPELVIKDAEGVDITEKFDITYGENINIGKGTITVTGKLEKGYCDQKTVSFIIYPKWMQWIFK